MKSYQILFLLLLTSLAQAELPVSIVGTFKERNGAFPSASVKLYTLSKLREHPISLLFTVTCVSALRCSGLLNVEKLYKRGFLTNSSIFETVTFSAR